MKSVRGFSDRILHTTSLLQVRSKAFRFAFVVSILLPRKLQPDSKNNLPDPGERDVLGGHLRKTQQVKLVRTTSSRQGSGT